MRTFEEYYSLQKKAKPEEMGMYIDDIAANLEQNPIAKDILVASRGNNDDLPPSAQKVFIGSFQEDEEENSGISWDQIINYYDNSRNQVARSFTITTRAIGSNLDVIGFNSVDIDPEDTVGSVLYKSSKSLNDAAKNLVERDPSMIRIFQNPPKWLQKFAIRQTPKAASYIKNMDPELEKTHGHIRDLSDIGAL